MNNRRHIASALLLSLLARVAIAGEVLFYGPQELPDPHQVAMILEPREAQPEPIRVRSLRLLTEVVRSDAANAKRVPTVRRSAARVTASSPSQEQNAAYSSFALPVQFSFDSARMSEQMTTQLDAVAEGLRLVRPGVKIVIEGHTDASGSPDHNLYLSLKRASMVKEYLIRRHGIEPESLLVMGLGETAPVNRTNPYAPENRRVEFRAEMA